MYVEDCEGWIVNDVERNGCRLISGVFWRN